MSRCYASRTEVDLGFYGRLNRILLWLIGLAVAGLVVLKYVPLIQRNAGFREQIGLQREAVRLKKAQVQANEQEIRRLGSDPRAIERQAREQLRLGRTDEWIVTF